MWSRYFYVAPFDKASRPNFSLRLFWSLEPALRACPQMLQDDDDGGGFGGGAEGAGGMGDDGDDDDGE